MHILITGVTGFAGGHLAELLLQQSGLRLFGICRQPEWPKSLSHLEGRVTLRGADLNDSAAMEQLLREIAPAQIYHLAGYAHAGQSFRDPAAAWRGNLEATRSLYDAVEAVGGKSRILFVGSGLVYGHPDTPNHAHDESCPLLPANPYAASKSAADLMSYQYTQFPGLDIVRARPFNHIGPRQSPQFAVAHFAEQIAAIERGQQEPVLETGNLSALRDFTDVRDAARAYVLLMEKGRTGQAYNVATGVAYAMQEVVDMLLSLAKRSIQLRTEPGLVRAVETAMVRGNPSKLRHETGWNSTYPFRETVKDTLEYWRQQP
jgi:GDP-4-dehydro-6-deoxy-D-mannose reductase